MLCALAAAIAARRRGLCAGSGSPCFAETVISRDSLENSLERCASCLLLRNMMFLNCEWPAIWILLLFGRSDRTARDFHQERHSSRKSIGVHPQSAKGGTGMQALDAGSIPTRPGRDKERHEVIVMRVRLQGVGRPQTVMDEVSGPMLNQGFVYPVGERAYPAGFRRVQARA